MFKAYTVTYVVEYLVGISGAEESIDASGILALHIWQEVILKYLPAVVEELPALVRDGRGKQAHLKRVGKEITCM